MPNPLSDLMDYVGSVREEEGYHEGDTQVENLNTTGGRGIMTRINVAPSFDKLYCSPILYMGQTNYIFQDLS